MSVRRKGAVVGNGVKVWAYVAGTPNGAEWVLFRWAYVPKQAVDAFMCRRHGRPGMRRLNLMKGPGISSTANTGHRSFSSRTTWWSSADFHPKTKPTPSLSPEKMSTCETRPGEGGEVVTEPPVHAAVDLKC
eukprot:scaffold3854_cov107-Isochrysis_galbana.AAC.8